MKYKNIKIKSEGLNNTKHKVEKLRQNIQIQAKKRILYDFIFDSDSNQAPLVIKHRELKKSAVLQEFRVKSSSILFKNIVFFCNIININIFVLSVALYTQA